ncbi:MAG: hypothetical protein ICV87_11325, partial [Gemmatimonadetes bacterium]|nr:hypothetical protein [Gemmatimonadota bacterium]
MPYRYQTLEKLMRGYEATGVPLVGSDGHVLSAEPYVDAGAGLYYLVPLIGRTFHVPLDTALAIYTAAAVGIGLVFGVVGAFLLFRSPWARASAVLGIGLVSAACYRFGEGYLCGAVAVLATIPLFLYLYRRGRTGPLLVALAATGLLVGVADQIRSLIGAPVLLFILLVLALDTAGAWRRRALCAAVLLLGCAVPYAYGAHLVRQRDAYVSTMANARRPAVLGDALWHPMYLGLGYLPNRYGITYSDMAAVNRVRTVDPSAPYLSPRYTDILRRAVGG